MVVMLLRVVGALLPIISIARNATAVVESGLVDRHRYTLAQGSPNGGYRRARDAARAAAAVDEAGPSAARMDPTDSDSDSGDLSPQTMLAVKASFMKSPGTNYSRKTKTAIDLR